MKIDGCWHFVEDVYSFMTRAGLPRCLEEDLGLPRDILEPWTSNTSNKAHSSLGEGGEK